MPFLTQSLKLCGGLPENQKKPFLILKTEPLEKLQ